LNKADFRNALLHTKTAIALNPENAHAHYLLGTINLSQGGLVTSAAKEYFETALKLDPQTPLYINALADWYARDRQFKKANELYEKSIALEPDNISTLISLGSYYLDDKRDLKKARNYATDALKLAPNVLAAQTLMGKIEYLQGNYPAAREHISLVLSQTPNDLKALYLLCAIDTHGNFLMRNIFKMMVWLSSEPTRFYSLIPIVFMVCLPIAALPENIKTPALWLVLLSVVYLIFKPYFFMQKVKRKYLRETTLRKDF
jgi:tetratricopeptide (TPR) repeat protein